MVESRIHAAGPRRTLALWGLCGAAVLGCGDATPYELAPVSGVVTLDGNPVPYTQITFMPKGSLDNPNPGPGSTAACDESGHFELKTVRGDTGAVVGLHTVKVSSKGPPRTTPSDEGLPPGQKEAFPKRYNEASELTFEVPADGTTTADFKLTTSP